MFYQQRSGFSKSDGECDVRATRESSVTSTVSSSITKPIKSQLASTAFSKSQWQSMAVKWQVSAESRWKNSEEKLSSSLKISRKHADQISNMKVSFEALSSPGNSSTETTTGAAAAQNLNSEFVSIYELTKV